jgi:raffinose/stachyose/melibiose transport system permease protein
MKRTPKVFITILLILISIVVLFPIIMVFFNSFKAGLYISKFPFDLPTMKGDNASYVGLANYFTGVKKIHFFSAFGYSLWITVASVAGILLLSSMLAWYITRVKNKFTSAIYYLLVFSMIVPFQMVMFTMSKMANLLHLDNPIGIIVIYVGFGCGLSTFMFAGFIKSIPLAMEEAAMIDGATPPQIFLHVILPMLKSQAVTIGILEVMWIWNDYLLPYLTIGTEYKTIPIAIQYLRGGYGAVDWGSMMAMLVLALLPVIVFYAICQKHIIKGVLAGAVKG